MKKNLIILLAVAMLGLDSCDTMVSSHEETSSRQSNLYQYQEDVKVEHSRFTYDGHVFIKFGNSGYRTVGYEHDPACLGRDLECILNSCSNEDFGESVPKQSGFLYQNQEGSQVEARRFVRDGHVFIKFGNAGYRTVGYVHDPECLKKDIEGAFSRQELESYLKKR